MQKIKYKDIELVVRAGTVQDELDALRIAEKIDRGEPDSTYSYSSHFGTLCSQTAKSKGLPYSPELLAQASVEQAKAAYAVFLKSDKRLRQLWTRALELADGPADPALGPTPLPDGVDPLA